MRKQHSHFFYSLIFVFSSLYSGISFGDELSSELLINLKERLLSEQVKTLEVRPGGMCLFSPKGERLFTKVAINCSRLFDALLEELYFNKDASIFSEVVKKGLHSPRVYLQLLEILQTDLKLLHETRWRTGDVSEEEVGPVILEIARLGTVLLKNAVGEQERIAFVDLIQASSSTLAEIFIEFAGERAILGFGSLLNDFINKDTELLELQLILSVLYGSEVQMLNRVNDFYLISPQGLAAVLDRLILQESIIREDNLLILKNVKGFLSSCGDVDRLNFSVICYQKLEMLPEPLSSTVYKELLVARKNYLLGAKELGLEDIQKFTAGPLTNYLPFRDLLEDEVFPLLLKREYQTTKEVKQACKILNLDPCPLELKQSKRETRKLFIFVLMTLLSSLLIFSLIKFFKLFRSRKQEKNIEKLQESFVLDPDERAELRILRKYFGLNPFEGVGELHKAYRKKVFQAHPDKLRDGGKEFVELQAYYLRAKDLLEKFEQSRDRKLANS